MFIYRQKTPFYFFLNKNHDPLFTKWDTYYKSVAHFLSHKKFKLTKFEKIVMAAVFYSEKKNILDFSVQNGVRVLILWPTAWDIDFLIDERFFYSWYILIDC